MTYLLNFDKQGVVFLNNFKGTFFDDISTFISRIDFLVVLFLLIFVIVLIKDRKNGKVVLIESASALILHFLIIEGLIKNFLYRPRPYLVIEQLIPLGRKFIDSSFPSGHLVIITALLTVLAYNFRQSVLPAILFVILAAFSRVYNAMHYPSDVLAGACLGLFFGGVSVKICSSMIYRRNSEKSNRC